MSIDRARAHLARFGLADAVVETTESSATVELAAQALGTQPERIAKSLSLLVGDDVVLVVAAGDVRIDNKKFKATFGTKARMVPGDRVEELVGHAVGGVCPFGLNDGVRVHLDESLRRFETVYPACGSANSAIELTLPQLEATSATLGWVDVTS